MDSDATVVVMTVAMTAFVTMLGCFCCTPCASQLICSCCFKASSRRKRPDNEAVPEVPQFSAEWLTAALRRGCPASANSGLQEAAKAHVVTALSHGDISVETEDGGEVINGGGLAGGRTMRVSNITYFSCGAVGSEGHDALGDIATNGVTLPRSMIAKWCSDVDVVGGSKSHPNSLYERVFFGWVLGLRHALDEAMIRELDFYNVIAPSVVQATGVRLPAVYYTGVDGSADTNCCMFTWRRDSVYCRTELLLEDLKLSEFEDCGHVILTYKQAVPLPVVETSMLLLGRLHAWGWGGRGLPRTMWTPLQVGCSSAQYLAVVWLFGWNSKLQYFLDLYHDHPRDRILQQEGVQAMLWDLRGSIHRWFPRARKMDKDQTTLHGDFHRGNLFYHKPTLRAKGRLGVSDVAVIDWSMIGSGHVAHELVYFFNTSFDRQRAAGVTPEDALAEERRLITLYHAELMRCKPGLKYGLDQLLDEVKMVWASYLIAMVLDNNAQASERAEDELSRRGPDPSKPRLDGFQNASVKASSALNGDLGLQRLTERFVAYHKDRQSWGDFFDGTPPPKRPDLATRQAQAKARADYKKALAILEAKTAQQFGEAMGTQRGNGNQKSKVL